MEPKDNITYNGLKLPYVGYGTYKIPTEEIPEALGRALDTGYRLVDTASFYGNEKSIGEVLSSHGNGENVIVQTKVWNDQQGYHETWKAFEESQNNLGNIDLYLIHWPIKRTLHETWKAMEEIYDQGAVKAIGVCNFTVEQLEEMASIEHIKPMVNQVEMHPLLTEEHLLNYCRSREIVVQAWRPLMNGTASHIPEVVHLAEKYGKTPSQIVLQWAIQRGTLPLPKSVTPSRIEENFYCTDFYLTEEEVSLIHGKNEGRRMGPDPEAFVWDK